jgi:hypothetical protein
MFRASWNLVGARDLVEWHEEARFVGSEKDAVESFVAAYPADVALGFPAWSERDTVFAALPPTGRPLAARTACLADPARRTSCAGAQTSSDRQPEQQRGRADRASEDADA